MKKLLFLIPFLSAAAGPLDDLESIAPNARIIVSPRHCLFQGVDSVPSFSTNTIVTVTRVDKEWAFFNTTGRGGIVELSCKTNDLKRVYSESEQALLLEKHKLDIEKENLNSKKLEFEKQAEERKKSEKGKLEGIVAAFRDDPSQYTITIYKYFPPQPWTDSHGLGGVHAERRDFVVKVFPDKTGRYSTELPPGDYQITCTAPNGNGSRKYYSVTIKPEKTETRSFR